MSVAKDIHFSGTIFKKASNMEVFLLQLLPPAKSDCSVPENCTFSNIIGLLIVESSLFCVSKNQGIFKLFFKAVDALNFSAYREKIGMTFYFSFFFAKNLTKKQEGGKMKV